MLVFSSGMFQKRQGRREGLGLASRLAWMDRRDGVGSMEVSCWCGLHGSLHNEDVQDKAKDEDEDKKL